MKFTISKTDLVQALTIVSKCKTNRSTLQILSGIYIKAENEQITLQSTDLEISIKHQTQALVEEAGDIVVSGKSLVDIVKSLPDAAITCYVNNSLFQIECLNSKFSLSTMDPQEFPTFPNIEKINKARVLSGDLSLLVRKVSKAIAHDEANLILTGINLTIEESKLKLVATDSYRLAIGELSVENNEQNFEALIPGMVFDDVCKLVLPEEELEIAYSENQLSFEFGSSIFITRKIEGNYPNIEKIIPRDKTTSALINTQALVEAVKRASLITQEYKQIRMLFDKDEQKLTIASKAADMSGSIETIETKIEGESLEIGFNYQYLIDGLTSIDTEETVFEASQSLKPGIFKANGGDEFFYLSMPVKLD